MTTTMMMMIMTLFLKKLIFGKYVYYFMDDPLS